MPDGTDEVDIARAQRKVSLQFDEARGGLTCSPPCALGRRASRAVWSRRLQSVAGTGHIVVAVMSGFSVDPGGRERETHCRQELLSRGKGT